MTDGFIGAAPTDTETATDGEGKMDGASDGLNGNEFNGMNDNGVERPVVRTAPLTGTVWEPVIFIERICAAASTGIEAESSEHITAKTTFRIRPFLN